MSAILDKVRKLLELKKSSNQHEAALAAEMASKLMTEHQISEMDLKPLEDTETFRVDNFVFEENSGKNVATWKSVIAWGCAKAHGADLYICHTGVKREMRMIGRERDLQTVRYMYSYLSNEVDRLADKEFATEVYEFRRSGMEPPHGKTWKTAFRRGAADEIYTRLVAGRETAKVAASTSTALVKLDKLESLVKAEKERLKLRKRQSASVKSRDAYRSGREAGKAMDLGNASRPGLGEGNRRLR